MSELLHSFDKRFRQAVRQHAFYVCKRPLSLDCRDKFRRDMSGRCGIRKISVTLYRDFPRSGRKCLFFQPALKSDSGERFVRTVICRCNGNNDCTVCICTVSAAVAHAVYRNASRLAAGVDHITARTHAERINASAAGSPCRHLIWSSA